MGAGLEQLEGDDAVESDLPDSIDDPEAAGAEFAEHLIARQSGETVRPTRPRGSAGSVPPHGRLTGAGRRSQKPQHRRRSGTRGAGNIEGGEVPLGRSQQLVEPFLTDRTALDMGVDGGLFTVGQPAEEELFQLGG
jgi:hypothetical protein